MMQAGMRCEIEMHAWASNAALTLTELRERVEKAGNVVLEEDVEGQRLLIGYSRQPVLTATDSE